MVSVHVLCILIGCHRSLTTAFICETLPANIAGHNQPADLADLPVCHSTQGTPPMNTTATPAAQPANITALQRQLLDLAARCKPTPQDRSQEPRGPVLVIRGK
jgi:hypothetical protein